MAELTSHYTALRVDAFKGVKLPDAMRKATLEANGRLLAKLEICKSGMMISYRVTITRGGMSRTRDVQEYVEFNFMKGSATAAKRSGAIARR